MCLLSLNEQLASVREELESFKESSHRWRFDAEAKWRNLKRAGETASKEAEACRQNSDDAERELATLKTAFRSFLKTLWNDLRSRPPPNGAVKAISSSGVPEDAGRVSRNDIGGTAAAAGNVAAAVAGVQAGVGVSTTNDGSVNAIATGIGEGGPFAELTEAEVSDMMQALSADSSSSGIPVAPSPRLEGEGALSVAPRIPSGLTGSVGVISSPSLTKELDAEDAFSARVETALAGQDTSAALADMLFSLRSQGLSEGGGRGGGRVEPLLLPHPSMHQPRQGQLARWRETVASDGLGALGSREGGGDVGGWPPSSPLSSVVTSALLGSGGSGRGLLGPLVEEALSSSPTDEAGFGFTGGHDRLVVEDLLSSS